MRPAHSGRAMGPSRLVGDNRKQMFLNSTFDRPQLTQEATIAPGPTSGHPAEIVPSAFTSKGIFGNAWAKEIRGSGVVYCLVWVFAKKKTEQPQTSKGSERITDRTTTGSFKNTKDYKQFPPGFTIIKCARKGELHCEPNGHAGTHAVPYTNSVTLGGFRGPLATGLWQTALRLVAENK